MCSLHEPSRLAQLATPSFRTLESIHRQQIKTPDYQKFRHPGTSQNLHERKALPIFCRRLDSLTSLLFGRWSLVAGRWPVSMNIFLNSIAFGPAD